MLRVYLSPNNIPEKKYIIDVLLSEYLGLEYSIEINNSNEYQIAFSEGRIIIEDSFWGNNETEDYLRLENIPQKIEILKNEFTDNNELPILFGSNKFIAKDKIIVLGLDIFASSFFMLTRWEEYVNPIRDNVDRFPGEASLAYKNNFIERPIVNEYVEMLWKVLKYLGYEGERQVKEYKIIPTVDVDHLYNYNKQFHFGKRAINLIKKDASYNNNNNKLSVKYKIKKSLEIISAYVKVRLNLSKDPFDTYETLMESSEKLNIKTYFFFLSGQNDIYDSNAAVNDENLSKIINTIKARGHYVGFHPGFDTFNDSLKWKEAKDHLYNISGDVNNYGRQHYLRFEVPKTWRIWEENKMEWDSSMGYSDINGFRCGTCYEFSVFDILERKQLYLKEYPLLVMDATFDNRGLTPYESILNLKIIKEKVKKYGGNFVFLWHNSSFNTIKWKNYKTVYEEMWL